MTPLHLGPALLVGFLCRKRIDIVAIAFGSVIVDIEALYYLSQHQFIHGFFHSYAGATIAGVVLAALLISLKNSVSRLKDLAGITEESSNSMIFVGSVTGAYSHVFLDSFLYWDIKPFFPSEANPFYSGSILAFAAVYLISTLCFVPAAHLYRKGG